jgi:predicted dehydrogenase
VLGNEHSDVAFITLGYPKGILGHIHVSWADAYKVREVVVVGSEERIAFNDFNPLERVRVFEKGVKMIEPEASSYGEYHFRMRDGDIISPRVDASEPLKNECSHFLECVRTGARPLSDAHVGRAVVQVMETIDRSMALHGTPVRISEEEEHGERFEIPSAVR